VLNAENALMSCMHFNRNFSFNPSTRFQTHLLLDCDKFSTTGTYQSGPVQADLKEEKQKLAKKI
jgi:hypothetical protein